MHARNFMDVSLTCHGRVIVAYDNTVRERSVRDRVIGGRSFHVRYFYQLYYVWLADWYIYIYIPRTNTSMMRDLPLVSMESVGRNEQFVSRKIIVVVRLADINTTQAQAEINGLLQCIQLQSRLGHPRSLLISFLHNLKVQTQLCVCVCIRGMYVWI